MKKLKVFFAWLTLGILVSCGSTKNGIQENMETETFWINSTKVDCVGVGPMTCLQIQKSDVILYKAWQNFYTKIEGFEYEPGYIYKVKVAVENLDPKTVPVDASTKRYKLIEVLEKKADPRLLINDIWVLTQIEGKDITISDERERPRLEIQVAKHRIAGKGVCNQMMGEIEDLTTKTIKFGAIGMTRKMCINNMPLEDQYAKLMGEVAEYTVEEGNLVLRRIGANENSAGTEILRFKKVD